MGLSFVGCPQSDFILRFNIRKIWIEKIGPLKLFVVLVPGLMCNFGWEVTIKIHYSTVSGRGVTPIYIYMCVCVCVYKKDEKVWKSGCFRMFCVQSDRSKIRYATLEIWLKTMGACLWKKNEVLKLLRFCGNFQVWISPWGSEWVLFPPRLGIGPAPVGRELIPGSRWSTQLFLPFFRVMWQPNRQPPIVVQWVYITHCISGQNMCKTQGWLGFVG